MLDLLHTPVSELSSTMAKTEKCMCVCVMQHTIYTAQEVRRTDKMLDHILPNKLALYDYIW